MPFLQGSSGRINFQEKNNALAWMALHRVCRYHSRHTHISRPGSAGNPYVKKTNTVLRKKAPDSSKRVTVKCDNLLSHSLIRSRVLRVERFACRGLMHTANVFLLMQKYSALKYPKSDAQSHHTLDRLSGSGETACATDANIGDFS